jgi:subtilisin family serine protease
MTRSASLRRRVVASCAVTLGLVVAAFSPVAASTSSASTAPTPGLVIQVDLADGYTIADVTAKFAVTIDRVMVARAGIYHVTPVKKLSASQLTALAGDMEKSRPVSAAVPDPGLDLTDTRFHSWPNGADNPIGTDANQYLNQPAAAQLPAAHAVSRGAGIRVAVLDTGVDANVPALKGKVGVGYDYIGDDNDPSEQRQGVDTNGDGRVDGSYGHGTFVAGLVALVAPDATIIPMRVLDSDGVGNEVVIAQAIRDAVVDYHANIINLSFGTDGNVASALIDSALYFAENSGVLVVVSAGNTGQSTPLYPGDSGDALAATAVGVGTDQIASYASHGPWVELAAPATGVIGPIPDGGYAQWSGTSMAAPMVSGQAALVESAAPQLTLNQTIKALTSSATKIGSANVRYGVVNVVASLTKAG